MKQAAVRMFENGMDWTISNEAPNRRTLNDYPGRGSRDKRLETESPKPLRRHGEDIVCTLQKYKDACNYAERAWRTRRYANRNNTV